MKFILTLCLLLCVFCPANAMLQVIGIEITQANGRTFVSIFSDDEKEIRKDITVDEATKIFTQVKKSEGGYTAIGIVARDIPLKDYLPLLKAIGENPVYTLAFVEATDPNFNAVIKKKT